MFRPLEAIFRLHKIDMEEKEYNIYSKRFLKKNTWECYMNELKRRTRSYGNLKERDILEDVIVDGSLVVTN